MEILEEVVETFENYDWQSLLNQLITILPAIAASIVAIVIKAIMDKLASKIENNVDKNNGDIAEANRIVKDMKIECEKKDAQIARQERLIKKLVDKIDDGE